MSLFEVLNKCPVPKREEQPIRMPVLGTYKLDGNLFVFGKLESGCIKEGKENENNLFLDYWVTSLPSRKEL